ncbi:polyprenyl synthetase family protein [Salicola sp. Rm-C-2C1-2]|uniref:polyprenyl synthetase family protein n=1 Tax=Salicola sp. Rm-C-2C1-2 TaxID=3141321 RepID=UPI0032E4CBDD
MTISCATTDVDVVRTNIRTRTNVTDAESEADTQELRQVKALMEERIMGLAHGPARDAASYQTDTGGSLLRARLALASGLAFQCSQQYRIAAAAACELIHNASLVHDDLSDGDEHRRGKPAVWKQFGNEVALCTGDLLLCTAFGVAASLADPQESTELTKQLTAMTSRTIVGQSQEVAASQKQVKPRLRSYLTTTMAKTVPLIELPLMTGAVAARAGSMARIQIERLANAIGLAYQIIDDLDDVVNGTEGLHPFHAWHHHRPIGQEEAEPRIKRATEHALASLKRAQRVLNELETTVPTALAPRLQPLLMQLEQRALAHRQNTPQTEEPTPNAPSL